MNRDEHVTIRDAKLLYRNFAGAPSDMNAEGDRNFCVELSEEQALHLQRNGWNVKPKNKHDEDPEQRYYLKIKLRFSPNGRPVKIYQVTELGENQHKTLLGEGLVSGLDWADINRANLTFRPYDWNMRGSSGRTAYLVTLVAYIQMDELEAEIFDIPELGVQGDQYMLESAVSFDYEGEVVDNPEPPRAIGGRR